MESVESGDGGDQVTRLERSVRDIEAACGYLDDLITTGDERERDESSKERAIENGRYWYIPFGRADFVRLLLAVRRLYDEGFEERLDCAHCGSTTHVKRAFVDVGCGLADKVFLASKMGYEAHGIEVDPYLVRAAKERYPFRERLESRCSRELPGNGDQGTLTIYPVDALKFDYSGFDVIYFYCPLKKTTLEAALERRIWRQAKRGAYVIACTSKTTPPPRMGFRKIEALDAFDIPSSVAVYVRESVPSRRDGGSRRPAKQKGAKADDPGKAAHDAAPESTLVSSTAARRRRSAGAR